jgi:hypothetical protein
MGLAIVAFDTSFSASEAVVRVSEVLLDARLVAGPRVHSPSC